MPLNSARMNDYRLVLGDKELKPIMVGGMGVNISTRELALEAARLGGVGHISDALTADVSDRLFGTHFVRIKQSAARPFQVWLRKQTWNLCRKKSSARRTCALKT